MAGLKLILDLKQYLVMDFLDEYNKLVEKYREREKNDANKKKLPDDDFLADTETP